MKQYILILFALLAFTACDEFENSAKPSKATYLPLVALQGDAEIVLGCNATSYVDEGCIMTEGGEELDVETTKYGLYFDGHFEDVTLNWSTAHWVYDHSEPGSPDLYDITYAAANVDGIPGVAARSVRWPECNGNMITSIAGMYKATVRRNGLNLGPDGLPMAGADDNGPFFIKDIGGGNYALSDGMGGWYEHGRGFGAYDGPALGMTIKANNIATNDFTYGPSFSISVFHGEVKTTAFTVDPVAKTINFTTTWDSDFIGGPNHTFTVVLTQCPDGVACWD